MAGQPDAQIGVFGHVMGIPAAQPFNRRAAEKQGRPTQRDHQTHPLQPGQDQTEPPGIFDGKAARQPVSSGVVEIKRTLQAGHLWPAIVKAVHDTVKLRRFRRIFGVIDADDAAPAEIQREIQRARFGFQRSFRHHHHPHPARQVGACQCRLCHVIFLFDHQQHIQQFARIFQPPDAADQTFGNIMFTKHRDHHRHHRQPGQCDRWRGRDAVGPIRPGLAEMAEHRRQFQPGADQQGQHRPAGDSQQHQRRGQPDQPAHQKRRPERLAAQAGAVPCAATFTLRHQSFSHQVQHRLPGHQNGGMQRAFAGQGHQHRAERLLQHRAQPGEIIGARGGDDGGTAHQPPGQ